jgi:hypothetical protein
MLKSVILYFSRSIECFEIFSSNHMTVVSYDREDKRSEREQDMGRTIVCQVPFSSITCQATGVDISSLKSKCGSKPSLPYCARVEIPLNVYKPCASLSSTSNVDYILPIEGFAPNSLTVSGARKVGALLGDDKRTVLILEMELDLSGESTMDETVDEDKCSETSEDTLDSV